jgi:hypothetical protein
MSLSQRAKSIFINSICSKKYGLEVIGIVEKIATPAVPAVAASVVYGAVTFTAVTAGLDGNGIDLVFDGIKDIDTVVNAWNAANPTNTVGFAGGLGTDVPLAGTASLAGGLNLVPEVIPGGSLSAKAKFVLKNAFCDKKAFEAFVIAVEANSSIDARTQKILGRVLCDKKALAEWIAIL